MRNNPLRIVFLKLAAMPPALMLLVIIGLAVTVTMMVTGKVSEQERQLASSHSFGSKASVVVSAAVIPARTEITESMLTKRVVAGTEVWQDAITAEEQVVGRTTDKTIPAHMQIREIDLR